jgi:hypothetical protein
MDESSPVQNRRRRRANVLLTAIVESCGRTLDAKLRNLSAEGALIEADVLPPEGTEISFRRGDLAVPGKVIWTSNRRAGIQFHTPLTPESLLRHVPTPRPRVLPSFRRPGLAPQPTTSAERSLEKLWGVAVARDPVAD